MSNADVQLWSDSPYLRLKAARKLNVRQKLQFSKKLTATAPKGEWPFGMPTSVNPWLLVMGISPGGGEHDCDCDGRLLAVGEVHPGFGGKYSEENWDGPFWKKVRELCFKFLKSVDARLKNETDCLAVSGLLNLGTKNQGRGAWNATDPKIVKWIPKAIEMLKPRIIVLLGWNSLFPNLCECWAETCFLGEVVHKKAQDKIQLNVDSKRRYWFRIWRLSTSWGNVAVVCWPNHPSQPPFSNNKKNWEKSIKQASLLLLKRKK